MVDFSFGYDFINSYKLVSLACVNSETHNLQAVFCLRILYTKRRLWSQAFLAKIVETGNKNLCVAEATHVLRRKLRFRAFPELVFPRILSLESEALEFWCNYTRV